MKNALSFLALAAAYLSFVLFQPKRQVEALAAWSHDNRGFYYSRDDEPKQTPAPEVVAFPDDFEAAELSWTRHY